MPHFDIANFQATSAMGFDFSECITRRNITIPEELLQLWGRVSRKVVTSSGTILGVYLKSI